MYNQSLVNLYIKEINQVLDMVEHAEEVKSPLMLMRAISHAGFLQSMLTDYRINGSHRGYSEELIKDLDSFNRFLSDLAWQASELVTIK